MTTQESSQAQTQTHIQLLIPMRYHSQTLTCDLVHCDAEINASWFSSLKIPGLLWTSKYSRSKTALASLDNFHKRNSPYESCWQFDWWIRRGKEMLFLILSYASGVVWAFPLALRARLSQSMLGWFAFPLAVHISEVVLIHAWSGLEKGLRPPSELVEVSSCWLNKPVTTTTLQLKEACVMRLSSCLCRR